MNNRVEYILSEILSLEVRGYIIIQLYRKSKAFTIKRFKIEMLDNNI